MGVVERHVRRQPDVEIEEDVVGRAARPDLMAAEHAGDAHDDRSRSAFGYHHLVAEDSRVVVAI